MTQFFLPFYNRVHAFVIELKNSTMGEKSDALANGFHDTFKTSEFGKIQVLYSAKLSRRARFQTWKIIRLGGTSFQLPVIDFNCCYWDSHVAKRAYVRIHENRIEINAPSMKLPGCVLKDDVQVVYFDTIGAAYKKEVMCTPFHFLGFLPWWGEVAATAPHPLLNYFFCFCCRDYVVGLEDADEFSKAMSIAYEEFKAREPVTLEDPPTNQMMVKGNSIQDIIHREKQVKEEKNKARGTNFQVSVAGHKVM